MRVIRYCLSIVTIILLGACQSNVVTQLAKNDVDFVAEYHRQAMEAHIFLLMEKLYKRNPKELHKQQNASITGQVKRLQQALQPDRPLYIDQMEGIEILNTAFDPSFSGDRVFMAVGGLLSMIHKSYGYHREFFIFDQLDQQKLYRSARNLEVFSWKLRTKHDQDLHPLLLSNQLHSDTTNLSFERLLGQLISLQDMMALIASDGGRRAINGVAQGVAKVVFLPI